MALSLRIHIIEKSVTKTLQFDPSTNIFDACKIIRDKCSELPDLGQPKDYGLFLPGEAYGSGAWLEGGKTLDYYLLRNGDVIEYRRKMRTLRVRTLDGASKTMLIDDSQVVTNLMVVICTKMGITNHDEYSLVRELPEDDGLGNKSENYGTLTLRRKKEEREKDVKMDQLRKKIRTDDEINWVDHTKTLREQGIEEDEVLLLRRKYFYSDQNIDANDPVQLNLLYVQARDAILDGTHPVTELKAAEFAGIQAQIQYGSHDPNKHRPGFLDLKEFLPSSYIKIKGMEKKIYQEHSKHGGLSELEAKSLYTKEARSLDTYGVSFFLVKEKMPGKNKLVPRLLGVTKDSVLRLDERTKEILKTWPLTTVKRWAASPNTFTLDFGDYSDSYYSVQTPEGEQIAQLIAGYIDIILKKKQAKDHLGIEGDEGSTLFEEIVSPFQATTVQRMGSNKAQPLITDSVAKPGIIQSPPEGINHIYTGQLQREQYTTTKNQIDMAHNPQPSMQRIERMETMSRMERSLLSGKEAIAKSEEYLDSPLNLQHIGNDPGSERWRECTFEGKKQNVSSQLASMNSSVAQLVSLSSKSGDELNVDETVVAIESGLPQVAQDMRMLAALMEERGGGQKLLQATKDLCSAFSSLLNAASPGAKEPRQNILSAAGRVGDASRALLNTIDEGDESGDVLLGLAKGVANSAAKLVVEAKKCSASVENGGEKEEIIYTASQAALSASELVACAKVLAPTIRNERCRNELVGASRKVSDSVELVLAASNSSSAEIGKKRSLEQAAKELSDALNRLLEHIRPAPRVSVHENLQEGAVDTILVASDKIITSTDSSDMVKQARILAQATAQLIQAIKGEAERTPDSDLQRKLLDAAKVLAEATSKLVEAAKSCASNPTLEGSKTLLREAAQEVREATNLAADGALERKSLKKLENCAKNSAAAAAQCIASAQSANSYIENGSTRELVSNDCRAVADSIPKLVSGIKSSMSSNGESGTTAELLNSIHKFLGPSVSLVATAKSAAPFIEHPTAGKHLSTCAQKLAFELIELRTSVERMRGDTSTSGGREWKSALARVDEINRVLEGIKTNKSALNPLPGDTEGNAIQRLTSSLRELGVCTDQLEASVLGSEPELGIRSAEGLCSALDDLVESSRALASTSPPSAPVLEETSRVVERVTEMIVMSGGMLGGGERGGGNNGGDIRRVGKEVREALGRVQDEIPAQRQIGKAVEELNSFDFERRRRVGSVSNGIGNSYGEAEKEVQSLANEVGELSLSLCSSVWNPSKLGEVSTYFSSKSIQLFERGVGLGNMHEEEEVRDNIVVSLKNIYLANSNLLLVAKNVAGNPGAPGAKNQLNAAARAVSERLSELIHATSSASPGQKECETNVRRILALQRLIDNPSEPLNDTSYFDCQEIVLENSKLLGDSMTGIANYAKEGKLFEFGKCVNSCGDAVCGLIESSVQGAYLLGASHPSSLPGRPGLLNYSSVRASGDEIKRAVRSLLEARGSTNSVLSSATAIAQHTSALCTTCRAASERTADPTTKRQFVQMAKELANTTAGLVKEIKSLEPDVEKKESLRKASRSLLSSVDTLVEFSSRSEFGAESAKISGEGRRLQEPILVPASSVVEASAQMLSAAKSLSLNPKDPPTWQQLALHSKHVSDSIKKLVTALREKGPGQKECEESVRKLEDLLRSLDQASLSAVSQSLKPRKESSVGTYLDSCSNALRSLDERVESLKRAGKGDAERLGHEVSSLSSLTQTLVNNIIGLSSNIVETKEQVNLLERSKTVIESAIQFISIAKESGGNSKAHSLHPDLDLSAQCFEEGLDDLKASLDRISSGAGSYVHSVTESIASTMLKLESGSALVHNENESFGDYQSRMVSSCKEIARVSSEIVSKSSSSPSALPALSSTLFKSYSELCSDVKGVSGASDQLGSRLKNGVLELGKGLIDLVSVSGGGGLSSTSPEYRVREVEEVGRGVSEKVSEILSILQLGSRGTQACINAASTVSGIIGDLDTTIMFATAGTLNPESNENFGSHRESIIRTAKALVQDTKTLVAGAASSQEELALGAQSAVSTIVQLSEAVKLGAGSLGSSNPESQVMLMNSVRDVAGGLYDLILSTKAASGKSDSHPSMQNLKESAKIMVTNVSSLLKTVKSVEDEHSRGTRALEATIEAIAQEIRAFDSPDGGRGKTVTAEELVRVTKPVTIATGKAVAAGSSCRQDDVIVAANMGRKVISDLLSCSKSLSVTLEGEIRERLLEGSREVGVHYRELLQYLLHTITNHPNDSKVQLSSYSKLIATSLTQIVSVAQLLKGSEFEDPDDPTVIAENELLGAANSIDAAAKKLEKLRPRRSIKEADESLNFDEMILEAAKSIAAATSALVKAASASQRELVDSGKVSRKIGNESDDGQWAEGLVSAAQMVAAATHSLVEAANLLVQGHATEEKLISAAKQVASSTAQLLVACKVKASPDSDSTKRLQAGGNAVIRATDNLVKAARQALSCEEEHQLIVHQKKVGSIAQVIDARADVLRIEKELEEARKRLAVIHKAKYQDPNDPQIMDDDEMEPPIPPPPPQMSIFTTSSSEMTSSFRPTVSPKPHQNSTTSQFSESKKMFMKPSEFIKQSSNVVETSSGNLSNISLKRIFNSQSSSTSSSTTSSSYFQNQKQEEK